MPAPSKYRVTPDELAIQLLESQILTVDIESGAIWRDGERAEVLHVKTGYGRVVVGNRPLRWAMAHRVVWIAAHGPIPPGLLINHMNLRRWDNRLANLELTTHTGNLRHARTRPDYVTVAAVSNGENEITLDRVRELMQGAEPERNPTVAGPFRRPAALTG